MKKAFGRIGMLALVVVAAWTLFSFVKQATRGVARVVAGRCAQYAANLELESWAEDESPEEDFDVWVSTSVGAAIEDVEARAGSDYLRDCDASIL